MKSAIVLDTEHRKGEVILVGIVEIRYKNLGKIILMMLQQPNQEKCLVSQVFSRDLQECNKGGKFKVKMSFRSGGIRVPR